MVTGEKHFTESRFRYVLQTSHLVSSKIDPKLSYVADHEKMTTEFKLIGFTHYN